MPSVQLNQRPKKYPIFVVDAFTTRNNASFTGNPASVCLVNFDVSSFPKRLAFDLVT
jgi:hypothetical protein